MKSSNDKRTRWSQLTPGTPVEIVFKPLTDPVWHQELGGGCTELSVQDCVGGDVSSYMVRQISLQHALKMRVTEVDEGGLIKFVLRHPEMWDWNEVTEDYVESFVVTGPSIEASHMDLWGTHDDTDPDGETDPEDLRSTLHVEFCVDGAVKINSAVIDEDDLAELHRRLTAHLAPC